MSAYNVKLTQLDDVPILRQTPGRAGVWEEFRFFADAEERDYDFWVVYGNLTEPARAVCPPERLLLLTPEPPGVDYYPRKFTDQFARVVTSHRRLNHRDKHHDQQGLPWRVGLDEHAQGRWNFDYDGFRAQETVPKSKKLSVISSNKAFTKGHRARLEFVAKLQDHFGPDLEVFGRGINEVADKWEAIADFEYHICLENSAVPDYWTEKLSDAYLALCYPIYHGCPNLGDYFAPDSFLAIDIDQPQHAMQQIERLLAEKPYDEALPALQRAKAHVLGEHNLFGLLAKHLRQMAQAPAGERRNIRLEPYLRWQGVGRQLVKRLGWNPRF